MIKLEIDLINPEISNVDETWLHRHMIDSFTGFTGYTFIRIILFPDGNVKRGSG